jgi:hypothetical protein
MKPTQVDTIFHHRLILQKQHSKTALENSILQKQRSKTALKNPRRSFYLGRNSTVSFWTGSTKDFGFWAGNFMFFHGIVKLARFGVAEADTGGTVGGLNQ